MDVLYFLCSSRSHWRYKYICLNLNRIYRKRNTGHTYYICITNIRDHVQICKIKDLKICLTAAFYYELRGSRSVQSKGGEQDEI